MKHVINLGDGQVLELNDSYGRLEMCLNEEDVSFSEAIIYKPEQIQKIIDALQEHKERMEKGE